MHTVPWCGVSSVWEWKPCVGGMSAGSADRQSHRQGPVLSGVGGPGREGLTVRWWPPTSSRAWCAFVASASSEEPGCVLFRMFYRTNSRQEPQGKRGRKTGSGGGGQANGEVQEQSSSSKFTPRRKGVGSGGTAHVAHGAGRAAGVWAVLHFGAPRAGSPPKAPLGGGEGPQQDLCTWSSSLRRVMRWKGRIRKDLRERRWQMGSLSSLSRTSRKLLLLFLQGQRASVRRAWGGLGWWGGHGEWRLRGMSVGGESMC